MQIFDDVERRKKMSKSKKPRKPYRPKDRPALPITFAMPRGAMTDLSLMPHACIMAIVDGSAVEANIYTLANCLNMGGLLAERKDLALLPIAVAGQEAIIRVIERFSRTGKIGFSGDNYQAIKAGVTLNDELQSFCTRRELRDVLTELMRST